MVQLPLTMGSKSLLQFFLNFCLHRETILGFGRFHSISISSLGPPVSSTVRREYLIISNLWIRFTPFVMGKKSIFKVIQPVLTKTNWESKKPIWNDDGHSSLHTKWQQIHGQPSKSYQNYERVGINHEIWLVYFDKHQKRARWILKHMTTYGRFAFFQYRPN